MLEHINPTPLKRGQIQNAILWATEDYERDLFASININNGRSRLSKRIKLRGAILVIMRFLAKVQ
jgi:hypothetical protein